MRWQTILLIACIMAGTAFLSSLGVWQLKRLAWKQDMIARVEKGIEREPVPVETIEKAMRQGEDIEYRPATATGRFLHEAEAYYFVTHQGKPGYFVYTPLQRADGRMLFVNRGFVSMEGKDPATRPEGQTEGEVTINGLARSAPAEKPNSFVPNNDLEQNVFYWKSLSQMAGRAYDKTEIDTLPFFLDADDAPVAGDAITGGVTRVTFSNSHLQYAITWFGLALSLLVVGGIFLRSRLRAS